MIIMELRGRDYLLIILFALGTIGVTETSRNQPCKSPQYVEFGTTGTIDCSFNENVFLLVWYNSTNFSENEPILSCKRSIKSGVGYTTGEFDIISNGSLIINRVGLEYDHYFTVVMTNSSSENIVPFTVRVIVTVKPYVLFPVINQCGNNSSPCFIQLQEDQEITCSIRGARPAMSLKWTTRTDNGDLNISFDVSVHPEGKGFSTIASVTFPELPELALLVCLADSRFPRLSNKESLILVQKTHGNITHPADPLIKFIQFKSQFKLTCNSNNSPFLIWKRRRKSNNYDETTIAAFHVMNNTAIHLSEDYYVDDEGSLMTTSADIHHEGIYTCLFGNGFKYGSDAYKVVVFVSAHPIIDGCEHQQQCILEKEYEGYLTCRLLGIRPALDLEWNIFPSKFFTKITFFDHSRNISTNGNYFDISLTSKYQLNDLSQQRLTVECKISNRAESPFVSATNLDLLFLEEPVSTENTTKADKIRFTWIIPVVFTFISVIALLIGLRALKARKKQRLNINAAFNGAQASVTFSNSVSEIQLSELKKKFITQLKGTYEEMYASVQPVPFVREKMFCVKDIFVEGGLEFIQWMYSESGEGSWERLRSYNDIFEDPRLKSKRYILEGEPGYGKSTLALKLAYDWCSGNNSSVLKDVDIFILLRLRQMGGRITISKAIKHLLLPQDSLLSEDDVTILLGSCTSALIVLDGYDEYPDFEKNDTTVVKKIIKRDIFQQVNVILTTRSYCLPKEYAAQTKRIRLTGFNELSREMYISKAVVGNKMENAKLLKACLKENPVLSDLCQVPLFFAMFAHITYERKEVQSFTSVTSFFRYIISCIHGHMQNKPNSASNGSDSGQSRVDHSQLDKEAFESLNEHNSRDRWIKDDMLENIGADCYDQLLGTGILIKEKIINIADFPNVTEYEYIQYTEEVRFYHKLFCEWYAAHYLSKIACECSLDHINKLLKGFNPLELQYLFRFTCGMNSKAAENIIKHLKQANVPDEIIILCIIEQTGNVNSILDAVRDLCSRAIDIRKKDSRMMQRSIAQLLEIASTRNIGISCLRFWDSFGPGKEATGDNSTDFRVLLTKLKGITCMEIHETDRMLEDEDAAAILKCVSTCMGLKSVKFFNCLMPYTLKVNDVLNFEVFWYTRLGDWYTLDALSGNWRMYVSPSQEGTKTGLNITESKYDQLVQLQ